MATKHRKRQWFIIKHFAKTEILALVSGFSIEHVKRQGPLGGDPFEILPARRWHIALVFSGLPRFYNYATPYGPEDVEGFVPNEFYMMGDDISSLVVVLS